MELPMAAAAAGPNLTFISYRWIKLVLNDLGLRVMWATSVWWHIWDNWTGPELWASLQPCPLASCSSPGWAIWASAAFSHHLQGLLCEKQIPHSALNIPQQCLQSVPPEDSQVRLCNSVSVPQRNYFIISLPMPLFPMQVLESSCSWAGLSQQQQDNEDEVGLFFGILCFLGTTSPLQLQIY